MRCQCAVLLGLACVRGFGPRPTLHGRPGRTLASTPGEILFEAQREAMAVAAEEEGACFEGRVTALPAPSLAAKPKSKAKAKRRRGAGFAGATDAAGDAAAAAAAAAASARWRALRKAGVLKIEGAIPREIAADLRAYVVDDLAAARAACAAAAEAGDAEARRENRRRFHSDVAERPLRSFLLTPLDEPRCHAGLRGLLASGSPLGDVFERACGGDDAQFYDFNALRTERGSPRQPVHWDTPFQERPPLYTAFVALQRVTREMGATLFLPGTHALDDGTRRGFDAGGAAKRAALEGARVFDGVLEPGDVTIFDMRVLHCGQPNLADLGDQRFFLNFTFCNPRADCSDLGHAPCIRPGYARRMTLADVRAQLASAAPFADLGDGLR